MKVFGCIGYVKTKTEHLRKLDDRSRILVHLGTEPGSKSYRMLDPINRKIVVSRDVIFDESKTWKWNNITNEEDDEPGKFKLIFGLLGNQSEEEKQENTEHDGEEEEKDNREREKDDEDSTGPSFSMEPETQDIPRRSTLTTKAPNYLSD